MMDAFMNVSMGTSRYASTPWLKLRLALLEMNDTHSRADDASRISHSSFFAIAVAAAAKRAAIPMNLPYHQTTQEHLFAQLRATVWSNDRSRIMVDLGSHAGHGRHHNLSDAMIWLHYFNHSGRVFAVDAFEDFALDLQQRFDMVPPYSSSSPAVRKESIVASLAAVDNTSRDMFWQLKHHVTCCAGNHTVRAWCAWPTKMINIDHLCGITIRRMSLPFTGQSRPLPPSSYPHEFYERTRLGRYTRKEWPPYRVRTLRVDTIWREHLHGARLDFVKIDVDTSWKDIGLEGMFTNRAFSMLVIELDASWGGRLYWGVGHADQLAWFAARHGYDTYLKVPCRRRGELGRKLHRRHGASIDVDEFQFLQPDISTWYHRLHANSERPFIPSGVTQASLGSVQDLLILDASLSWDRLLAAAREDCVGVGLPSPDGVRTQRSDQPNAALG